MAMTKGERQELSALIRKRERVMRATVESRSSDLLAEFEQQAAAIYKFNDDAVWERAKELAQNAVAGANKEIAERCAQLGIPPEFAPGLSIGWYGRGENAVAERRAELRRAAKASIEASEKLALAKIERMSLDAQTEVVAHGLESSAARDFLERMPSLDALMPMIDAQQIKQLVDAKRRKASHDYD